MVDRIKLTLTRPQINELFMLCEWSAADAGEDEKIQEISGNLYQMLKRLPNKTLTMYLTPDEIFTVSAIASLEGDWPGTARSGRLADNIYWRARKAMEEHGINYVKFLHEFYGVPEDFDPFKKEGA